jgi:hypothetical protein
MAHNYFMKIFKTVKPGRHPDLFLVLPMVIVSVPFWRPSKYSQPPLTCEFFLKQLGISARRLEDRNLIRERMLSLPDCARPNTLGNEVVRMLDDIWTQADLLGRPAVWSDLRLACLRVTGM